MGNVEFFKTHIEEMGLKDLLTRDDNGPFFDEVNGLMLELIEIFEDNNFSPNIDMVKDWIKKCPGKTDRFGMTFLMVYGYAEEYVGTPKPESTLNIDSLF